MEGTPHDYTSVVQEQRNQPLTDLQLIADDILEELEHGLRGDSYDTTNLRWIPVKNKSDRIILVDKGIRDVINICRVFISRLTILSDLTEEEIYKTMQAISEENIWHLARNAEEYFGNDTDRIATAENIINHAIFITLKRALNAGERTSLSERVTQIERYEQDKKGGVFPHIFGGKKE
jgi:hypothetical protein